MINTYTYRLLLQTTDHIEWLVNKADDSKQLTSKTTLLFFNTFSLEGFEFENLLKEIDAKLNRYSMVVAGEHVGHLELYSKNMTSTLEISMNLNGDEIPEIWKENTSED
jgi:hypothetical protein